MKAETNTSDYESYDTDGWRSFCSSATNPWLDDKQPIEQIPSQKYNAEVSLSWQELLKKSLSWQELLKITELARVAETLCAISYRIIQIM